MLLGAWLIVWIERWANQVRWHLERNHIVFGGFVASGTQQCARHDLGRSCAENMQFPRSLLIAKQFDTYWYTIFPVIFWLFLVCPAMTMDYAMRQSLDPFRMRHLRRGTKTLGRPGAGARNFASFSCGLCRLRSSCTHRKSPTSAIYRKKALEYTYLNKA